MRSSLICSGIADSTVHSFCVVILIDGVVFIVLAGEVAIVRFSKKGTEADAEEKADEMNKR